MSPEMKQKAEELAKARGIEIDFSRFGGGGNRSNAPTGAPVTRTVYKLVGTDPKAPQLQAVSVKLGITDGIATEAIDGLKEGDVIVTGISVASKGSASAPASNPFGGGQRRF
jgi:HlyD family secretion protein